MRVETYGPGGFDPSKKNSNVLTVEEVEAPDPEPDPRDVRIAALEARLDAVSALAEKADATATEVARAAREVKPSPSDPVARG